MIIISNFVKTEIGQVAFTGDKNRPKTVTFPIVIGIAQIVRDFLQEFGFHYIGFRLNNRDAAAAVTFRTEPFGTLQTIPASTTGILTDEVHEFLEINPDAVTGAGEIFVELATLEELSKFA